MTKFIFKFDCKLAVYTDRKLIISVCHCHITSYLDRYDRYKKKKKKKKKIDIII